MHLNMSIAARFAVASIGAAAAVTPVNGSIIDMRGFRSVLFLAQLGDVSAGSVVGLTAQASDDPAMAGAFDIASTASFTADATNADNRLVMLDVHDAGSRYLRVTATRTGATAAVTSIIAVLYNAEQHPVVQGADVISTFFRNGPTG